MSKPFRPPLYTGYLEDFVSNLRAEVFASQVKAADYLLVNRSSISKYEKGTVRPPIGYLASLAKCLLKELASNDNDIGNLRDALLKEINKAIRSSYFSDEKPFVDWNELEETVKFYKTERQKIVAKSQTGASAQGRMANEVSSPFAVEILKPIQIEKNKPHHPGSAPPVPSLIIGRENDLQKLKEQLGIFLAEKPEHPIQILTAIRGWPGVGKTTIASALAHDPDIATAFPDGILWVSLGKEPNLLSEIASWGRALGTDELLRTRTLDEASAQLIALLRHSSTLLIIDDVWDAKHALPFSVGGRNCATLITTRQKDIANILAPTPNNVYLLPILTDDKALELLRVLAPTVIAQYPDEALELIHELEGLPLALQVAGRLLNTEIGHGFGVQKLITELQTGAKLMEAEAPADRFDLASETIPTVAVLLQKSVERLDAITLDYYAYLGVFAPKPATFNLRAMQSVWQVEDAKPFARTLVDRGLLEFVPEIKRYQMHAVLVMHAKTLLTD